MFACLELIRILFDIDNLQTYNLNKLGIVFYACFSLAFLLFLYFYLYCNKLKILCLIRHNFKEVKNKNKRQRLVKQNRNQILFFQNKTCKQNHFWTSHLAKIKIMAVLVTVTKCYVMAQIDYDINFNLNAVLYKNWLSMGSLYFSSFILLNILISFIYKIKIKR